MNAETLIDKIGILREQLAGGVTPAMATPLQPDSVAVNTAVVPQLVDFLLAAGVRGLFVGGTTGEGILLSQTERMRLHEAAVFAVRGRAPVLLHTGCNQLNNTIALSRHAAEIGAAAVAVVTPYFYGLDDDSLASYYLAVAGSVPALPLLLYDIPQMAINGISPGLIDRLGQSLPSLAGIKTSRPDAQAVRRLVDAAPEHLIVLVGNESAALGLLALGANGLISGLSTAVPEPFVALTKAFSEGKLGEARSHQRTINQLLDLMPKGARIGSIKQILAARGLAVGPAVPPRPMPDIDVWQAFRPILGQ